MAVKEKMKKYYLTPRFRFLHSISGLVFSAFITIFLFIFRDIPLFNLFFVALLIFTIISAIYWIGRENITISDKGIEYEGPDVAFVTNWDSVEIITSGWYLPARVEGIVVDKSLIRVIKMALGTIKRFPFWGVSQRVFIPLSCFADNWRDSELGQQIKQYAPHLFKKEKSVQSA